MTTMTKARTAVDAPDLGPVGEDPAVVAARAREVEAWAAKERASTAARACRAVLAQPAGTDRHAALRARVALPGVELQEQETALAHSDAVQHTQAVEAEARRVRLPAAQARVRVLLHRFYEVLDREAVPLMVLLRDQIQQENAALGRPMVVASDVLWPELLGYGGESLLELRRTLLQRAGWLDA